MRIRFVKATTLEVVETKNIDGKLEILEYTEELPVNKMLEVSDIFQTDNISKINFQIEKENSLKLYQNADLTSVTIHNGLPSFMEPPRESVVNNVQPRKCGGCPGK